MQSSLPDMGEVGSSLTSLGGLVRLGPWPQFRGTLDRARPLLRTDCQVMSVYSRHPSGILVI